MHRVRRTRRASVLAAALIAFGGLLSSCASPTSAFAPSASDCFATLPVADAAVGDNATLLGVRYLSEATINADLLRRNELPIPTGDFPVSERLCLVGYKGPFEARKLTSPWPPHRLRARAALVVFAPNRRHIFHTVLVDELPLRLSRI
jgi:hypothetical protein